MNDDQGRQKPKISAGDIAQSVLNAIQNAVILIDEEGYIAFANWEAESFFGASAAYLARHTIYAYIPFGSPMLTLIDQVRERRAPVNEYRVDLSSPRLGADKLVPTSAKTTNTSPKKSKTRSIKTPTPQPSTPPETSHPHASATH